MDESNKYVFEDREKKLNIDHANVHKLNMITQYILENSQNDHRTKNQKDDGLGKSDLLETVKFHVCTIPFIIQPLGYVIPFKMNN